MKKHSALSLICLFSVAFTAYTDACMKPRMYEICEGNYSNEPRGCDPDNQGCGHYGASRDSGIPHKGVDVKCTGGQDVYAAFTGTVTERRWPYHRRSTLGGSCCNTGLLLVGTGSWTGYRVKYFYVRPTVSMDSRVNGGQKIAEHVGVHCGGCHGPSMTDHIHFQLENTTSKEVLDPTRHLENPCWSSIV